MFLYALTIAAFASNVAFAKIPSYIHICKRNDPKIEQCILNSIEHLRPKLAKGIPELDVPSLEPIHLPEIVISRGNNGVRAVGSDVVVRGASNFKITSLKVNLDKNEYQVDLQIPSLQFNAIYDVNAKLLSMNIKGKGPITGNATDVDGRAILKGHKEDKNGKTYLKFDTLDLKLRLKNYSVHLENLFNGDKALGEAVNIALNENKKELINLMRPRAEEMISKLLLQSANKITQHFEYKDLFPAK